MQGNGRRRGNKRKSDDLLGGLLGGLTSGKGLVTAIGLGIGAFEILKNQSADSGGRASGGERQTGHSGPPPIHSKSPASPTSSATHRAGTPPPPPIPRTMLEQKQPSEKPVLPPPHTARPETDGPSISASSSGQELALRLIQTMVAAAHADGQLDQAEEQRILEQIQSQGLSEEEKRFLLAQLHTPLSIQELTSSISNPTLAQTIYSLAVSTIIIDTEQERQWLNELASALSISDGMKRFIEEEL